MYWSGLKDNKLHGENGTEQKGTEKNGLLLFVYLFINFYLSNNLVIYF